MPLPARPVDATTYRVVVARAQVKDGAKVRLHNGGVYAGDRRIALGHERTDLEIHDLMIEAKTGLVAHLEAFAGNTIEFIRSESPLLIDGMGIPDVDVDLRRRHVVVVAEGDSAADDLKALKPFIKEYQPVLVGVGVGADVLRKAGHRPALIVGDPDVMSVEVLRSGAVDDADDPAAADDRVVADVVAHGAGAAEERALDPALTHLQDAVPLPDAVLEAEGGDVAGLGQLVDLPLVLDQAQLGEELGDLRVRGGGGLRVHAGLGAHAGQQGVHVLVGLAQQAHGGAVSGDVLGDGGLELLEPGGAQARAGGQAGERGARADPELAGAGVRVELLRVPARQGTEVQGGRVVRAAVPGARVRGLEHEHGIRLVVHTEAREVREGRVRAEAVVSVIGADLQLAGRDHEALAREAGGHRGAAARGVLPCRTSTSAPMPPCAAIAC